MLSIKSLIVGALRVVLLPFTGINGKYESICKHKMLDFTVVHRNNGAQAQEDGQ